MCEEFMGSEEDPSKIHLTRFFIGVSCVAIGWYFFRENWYGRSSSRIFFIPYIQVPIGGLFGMFLMAMFLGAFLVLFEIYRGIKWIWQHAPAVEVT